jgi:hypothetical protein
VTAAVVVAITVSTLSEPAVDDRELAALTKSLGAFLHGRSAT